MTVPGPRPPPIALPKSPPTSAPTTAPPAGFPCWSTVVWRIQAISPNRSAGGATHVVVRVWVVVQATRAATSGTAARW